MCTRPAQLSLECPSAFCPSKIGRLLFDQDAWYADRQAPPAPPALSPSHESRDGFVREVVEQYKRRREWIILHDVRAIVEEVEGLLGPPT